MKTSPSQFNMMVTFMEDHGDLTKPSGKASGNLEAIRLWEQLKDILNSDGSGEARSIEKWRKVWSDMKNNLNKKAARIHRAASGTGGGPALLKKLTDLEQRVLAIIKPQAATGLSVCEAGLLQDPLELQGSPPPLTQPTAEFEIITPEVIEHNSANLSGQTTATDVLTIENLAQERDIMSEEWNQPGTSSQPHIAPPIRNRQTIPRRKLYAQRSPRLRHISAYQRSEQAFLQSDQDWRRFLSKKHEKDQENEEKRLQLRAAEIKVQQEQIILRASEIKLQEQWQQIINQALNILNNFIKK